MTEADLLRRVCLDPADDLPRLLFADWCDETGRHDRAEFIRCQIEKVQVYRDRPKGILSPYFDTHSWKVRFEELQARERDLQASGVDWWDDYGGPEVHVLEWRRGFAEHIAVSCEFWLKHGPAIVRQQPITRVVLSDATQPGAAASLVRAMDAAFFPAGANLESALFWARCEAGLDVRCKTCKGFGWAAEPRPGSACPDCKGTGWVTV